MLEKLNYQPSKKAISEMKTTRNSQRNASVSLGKKTKVGNRMRGRENRTKTTGVTTARKTETTRSPRWTTTETHHIVPVDEGRTTRPNTPGSKGKGSNASIAKRPFGKTKKGPKEKNGSTRRPATKTPKVTPKKGNRKTTLPVQVGITPQSA